MAKTPEEMAAAMVRGLKEKTGKTLAQWVALAKKSGETKHGAIVKHLKVEHGLTHGYANLVAHEFLGGSSYSSDATDLVAAQYAGKKAALLPIYEKLHREIAKFGEVEFAPKKTYVSLRRSKQFGLIQPSTATRVDVGLNLPGEAATERLEASGSFNSMVTHRVRLASPGEVDAELLGWLRTAHGRA
jgi:hypothetical protein